VRSSQLMITVWKHKMTEFGQCYIMKQTEEPIVFQIDDDAFGKLNAGGPNLRAFFEFACLHSNFGLGLWLRARQGCEFEIAVKRCEF